MREHQADTGVVFAASVLCWQLAITLSGCGDRQDGESGSGSGASGGSPSAVVADSSAAAPGRADVQPERTLDLQLSATSLPADTPALVADAIAAARASAERERTGESWLALARVLHSNGLPHDALPVWRAVATCADAANAQRAQAWRGVAASHRAALETSAASEALAQAAALAPEDPWPLIAATEWALEDGELEAAHAAIDAALARAPGSPAALTARARLALEEGDGATAERLLDPLAARSAWHASLLAAALTLQGKEGGSPGSEAATRPPSEDPFDLLLASARATREAVIARVDDALDRRQFEEALVLASRAVQALPDDTLALDRLSRAQAARGDLAGSAQTLLRACAIAPGDFGSRFNAGGALLQLQRFDEALPQLEAACQLAPAHGPAQQMRGLTLFGLRRFADAVAALEPLERDHRMSDGHARLALAVSLTEVGRPKDGEFVAFQVLNVERNSERAWIVLAESIRRQGDLARAAATAAKGAEFVPQSQALPAFVQQCAREAQGG